jgi:hypothetical protein
MSAANIAALKFLFSPPPIGASTVTTQQLQQQEMVALVAAKMAQLYAMAELPQAQAALATVDAEINSNPVTASAALRQEAETLQAQINQYNELLDNEYLDYTNNVQAWYANMTSGAKYVPLNEWGETIPANYPNMLAVEAQVTF